MTADALASVQLIDVSTIAAPVREQLASLWQSRAYAETSVRTVFLGVATELAATGAHDEVVALARHAAEDEARHAAICTALASVYRGAPVEPAAAPPVRLPDYVADRRMRIALQIVNLCCVSETLAVAFVEACIDECADPALRDIHGRHMADEIRHARIGWAHLASLTPFERATVATWIPQLVRVNVTAWESRLATLPEAGVPGHGYPPRARLVDAVRSAVRDLVLPGFEYVGIAGRETAVRSATLRAT